MFFVKLRSVCLPIAYKSVNVKYNLAVGKYNTMCRNVIGCQFVSI
jgi:hypothetical protein